MQFFDGIPVCGRPDQGEVSQIKTCVRTADHVALMADHHQGYAVPTGGVAAYKDAISPPGVGYDIACGNKAVQVNMPDDKLREIGVRLGGVFVGLGSEFAFGFLGHQIRADEWIEIAVEDFVHVADFEFGSMVLN